MLRRTRMAVNYIRAGQFGSADATARTEVVSRLIHGFSRLRLLAVSGVVATLLVACGDGPGSTGNTGGMSGKFFYELPASPGQGMTLEFSEDGTVVGTRPGGGAQQGTYRRDADKVIVSLTGDGANLSYTLASDGNLTTIFYGSETAVFVKQ